jgi:hypothetical protein
MITMVVALLPFGNSIRGRIRLPRKRESRGSCEERVPTGLYPPLDRGRERAEQESSFSGYR